jgi:hypothetical protein
MGKDWWKSKIMKSWSQVRIKALLWTLHSIFTVRPSGLCVYLFSNIPLHQPREFARVLNPCRSALTSATLNRCRLSNLCAPPTRVKRPRYRPVAIYTLRRSVYACQCTSLLFAHLVNCLWFKIPPLSLMHDMSLLYLTR